MSAWVAGGIIAVVLLYAGLRWFTSASPADLAHAARTFAAVFSALASTGLIFAGRWGLALITVAATVMAIRAVRAGRRGADPMGEAGEGEEGAAVETALLRMRLDRRSGRIEGEVKAGRFQGQSLGRLGLPALLKLLAEAMRDDPPSADLLEAYLDRRHPDWRQQQGRESGGPHAQAAGATAMTEAMALEILGLRPGAGPDEIRAAHRRLMAKLHPDHGGSTFLASQINQAKDLLLRASRSG